MCAKSTQLCLTLCNPMHCSPPGSSVHGILQKRIWSGLPCPSPGYLPNPEIKYTSHISPALVGRFFTSSTTWEALLCRWITTITILLLFSCSVVSDTFETHGLQHARLPSPSPSPTACSTHVHRVADAIQISCSLSSPSPPKEQVSFNFMATVTICGDFGAQENKVCHCSHCFPIYLP